MPGALVAGGWLTFFAVAIAFQPAPEPGMTWPVWVTAVSVVQIMLLLGAAAVGPAFAKLGFAGAALAGPLGIALAVNCRAAEHHLGNWWLVELGAAIAPHRRSPPAGFSSGYAASRRAAPIEAPRSGRRSALRPCAGCR